MGCDIHSFVLVGKKDQTYEIATVKAYDSLFKEMRYVQAWDGRSYDFFGFLTDGAVRGSECEACHLKINSSRFNKQYITNYTEDQNDMQFNQIAVDYYNEQYYHSHHYVSLYSLKKGYKRLKKLIKYEQQPQLKMYYKDLKCCLKQMITVVEAIAMQCTGCYDCEKVVVCYCFDN